MNMADLQQLLDGHADALSTFIQKQTGALGRLDEAQVNFTQRLLALEQALAAGGARLGAGAPSEPDTPGGRLVKALDRSSSTAAGASAWRSPA